MGQQAKVIIVQGHPCTGKSVLVRKIQSDLGLPCLAKDEFKELLFDELGMGDHEWSMKLGGASFEIFFKSFEKLLCSKKSFALESNFNPTQHRIRLKTLLEIHRYEAIEVILDSDPNILLKRFRARWESGERHRGHVDNERYADLDHRLKGDKLSPLGLAHTQFKLDTSDFEKVDFDGLIQELKKALV